MSGNTALAAYQLPHTPLLTTQEVLKLSQCIAEGDKEARDRFIEANMRLVVDIVKRYRCDHLDAEDLVQEGIFGLMRAVEKFDPARGYTFSTMAKWWIQQAIIRAIDQFDRPIRLPEHLMENLRVIHKAATRLHMDLHRTPTEDELARYTGKPVCVVRLVRSAPQITRSLDTTVDPFNPHAETFGEFVEDPDCNVEEDYIAHMKDEQALLRRVIETSLTEREKDIFVLYYGIDCNEHITAQIAVQYAITKQRVQQILALATRKVHKAILETVAKRHAACRQEQAS